MLGGQALGQDQEWARDLYRAATFTLIGGVVASLLALLTGFWDWLKSTEKGTQAVPLMRGRW